MLLHRGQFSNYVTDSSQNIIDESLRRSRTFSESAIRSASGTTVFISHKHSDLDNGELSDILKYMVRCFKIVPYIDSMDPQMPVKTCAETADRIKKVIGRCERFILLATEEALASKWCNWEVGIADKTKYINGEMAILPILDREQLEKNYSGNEYLRLYPYIIRERNVLGNLTHYVVYPQRNIKVTLSNWLNGSNNIND